MKIRGVLGICVPVLLCPVLFCLGGGAAAQTDAKAPASVTAVLLTTDIQLAADGSSVETVHAELRAGNDAGALRIGQTSIGYDSTGQDLAVVEAHTLKPDGKTLPVDASAIYDQPMPGQAGQFITGLRAKVIVFPQVATGDTAIYTIKITTRHSNFPGQFFYGELFPRTQAYNEVRETVTAPKSFPLYAESHEVQAGKREDGGNVIYNWRYSAPNPLAEVPVTLSPQDHMPRFFISSFKDYGALGRAYAALQEPKRIVTPKIQALADEITKGAADPRAQAQKLYEWVSSHIRYVGIELGTGSFIPHEVDAIVANGYGDCKDHDILLQALLKAKGIESHSILINGGGGGYTLTDVPTFTFLDHVITYVPQLNLYLDSTAAVAPFGVLPLQEYGKPMVVATAATARLDRMPVLAPGTAKVALKTALAVDKDGNVTGTVATTASGPYAVILRQIGLQIQSAGPGAAARLLTASGYENTAGTFATDPPTSFAPDYTVAATVKWSGWAKYLDGKTSFWIPPGMRLLGQSGEGAMGPFNPGNMNQDEPTVCFSAQESEDLSLKAPPGHSFERVPSDVRVETPNLLFTAHWSLAGDTMNVHRDFTSKIDQPLCSGAVRTRTAAALKQIAESYDATILFAEPGKAGDANAGAAQGFYNSGFAHLNAKEYELAIADLDKAIALKQDDANYYSARAFAQEQRGHHDPALADYGKVLALLPDNAKVYGLRGDIYRGAEKYDLALADYDKAIALDPGGPEAYRSYYGRGSVRDKKGQSNLALADFGETIALKPDTPYPFIGRGLSKIKLGQFDSALTDLDQAMKLEPDNFLTLKLRGIAQMVLGHSALAIADFDKAVALKSDDAELLRDRGFVHARLGDYALAIADYDKAIALKPGYALAFKDRGDAKTKLGQKEDGDRDLAMAVKLDPALGK